MRERYILLGDFNACVGCRTDHNDVWGDVHGPMGMLSVKRWLGKVVTAVASDAARSVPQWVIKKVSRTIIDSISS